MGEVRADHLDKILDWQTVLTGSDRIRRSEYAEFHPMNLSTINTPGTINISIDALDEFHWPRRSYLLVSGYICKATGGARYTNTDDITFSNFGPLHLFSSAKYELAGNEIESILNPAIASTILAAAKFSTGYGAPDSQALANCWARDNNKGSASNANLGWMSRRKVTTTDYLGTDADKNKVGDFSFVIDLEHLFGFGEDYDQVTYGMKHKLSLVRAGDNNALLRADGTDPGKVVLQNLAWVMPRIVPSDVEKFRMYKLIENKITVHCGFRKRQLVSTEIATNTINHTWRIGVNSSAEKPRHVLVAFQKSDVDGKQDKNPSVFDHANMKQIHVLLNDVRYPSRDKIVDFSNHHYIEHYKSFSHFARDFYGIDTLLVPNSIGPIEYKDTYPIFHIDVSKQSERITSGVVDIQIKFTFAEAVKDTSLRAYALIISDSLIDFASDGSKMNIVR